MLKSKKWNLESCPVGCRDLIERHSKDIDGLVAELGPAVQAELKYKIVQLARATFEAGRVDEVSFGPVRNLVSASGDRIA
jgi:hypothetical protein